jgi:hypothetical protein
LLEKSRAEAGSGNCWSAGHLRHQAAIGIFELPFAKQSLKINGSAVAKAVPLGYPNWPNPVHFADAGGEGRSFEAGYTIAQLGSAWMWG